jgi:hypothetical protein
MHLLKVIVSVKVSHLQTTKGALYLTNADIISTQKRNSDESPDTATQHDLARGSRKRSQLVDTDTCAGLALDSAPEHGYDNLYTVKRRKTCLPFKMIYRVGSSVFAKLQKTANRECQRRKRRQDGFSDA